MLVTSFIFGFEGILYAYCLFLLSIIWYTEVLIFLVRCFLISFALIFLGFFTVVINLRWKFHISQRCLEVQENQFQWFTLRPRLRLKSFGKDVWGLHKVNDLEVLGENQSWRLKSFKNLLLVLEGLINRVWRLAWVFLKINS